MCNPPFQILEEYGQCPVQHQFLLCCTYIGWDCHSAGNGWDSGFTVCSRSLWKICWRTLSCQTLTTMSQRTSSVVYNFYISLFIRTIRHKLPNWVMKVQSICSTCRTPLVEISGDNCSHATWRWAEFRFHSIILNHSEDRAGELFTEFDNNVPLYLIVGIIACIHAWFRRTIRHFKHVKSCCIRGGQCPVRLLSEPHSCTGRDVVWREVYAA